MRHPRSGRETYSTEAAARAAKTRMQKSSPNTLEVMTAEAYRAQVPMRKVTNLMTGKKFMEPADLPWHCSVGSESYWSA
jgi:hypothetical protein